MGNVLTEIVEISEGAIIAEGSGETFAVGKLVDIQSGNKKISGRVKGFAKGTVNIEPFGNTDQLDIYNTQITSRGQASFIMNQEMMMGRWFDSFGKPADGMPEFEGEEIQIGTRVLNPNKRVLPSKPMVVNIPAIDLQYTLAPGQAITLAVHPSESYEEFLLKFATNADVDVVIPVLIFQPPDKAARYREAFSKVPDKFIGFVHTTRDDPQVAKIILHTALTLAERLMIKGKRVLVVPDNMTVLAEVYTSTQTAAGRAPGYGGMAADMYTMLADYYECAGLIENGGFISIFSVTQLDQNLFDGSVMNNTGYITLGQLELQGGILTQRSISRMREGVIDQLLPSETMLRLVLTGMKAIYAAALESQRKIEKFFQEPTPRDVILGGIRSTIDSEVYNILVVMPPKEAFEKVCATLAPLGDDLELFMAPEAVKYLKEEYCS